MAVYPTDVRAVTPYYLEACKGKIRHTETQQTVSAEYVVARLTVVEAALATAEKRLRHSEFHRSSNRRSMRERGKTLVKLATKIERQREQLRALVGGPKLSAMERAAELHHSLRTEPPA